ncbi:antimicrobial protein CAP18-like [Monodelphis domestica]|uniref:antimicrobial protein CAP18-like n=1 Tax=Monodelphis domestica TaxID=13616 RepID=UPI0024E199A1|nr:antimicrobial protein CAP18-like [Monodelphis domestica]
MASFRILLPLLLLGLMEVKATEVRGLSYYDALTIAMSHFNSKCDEKNAYWITAITPQLKWDRKSKEPHRMGFAIQETECLKGETRTPSKCAFKKDGEEKYCRAAVKFICDGEADVWVRCSPMASNTIVRRSKRGIKVPGFVKKFLKDVVSETISHSIPKAISAVDKLIKKKKKGATTPRVK